MRLVPGFRDATYDALILGILCFISPCGWGTVAGTCARLNMIASFAFAALVVIAGVRAIQSWWKAGSLLRLPMIAASVALLLAGVWLGWLAPVEASWSRYDAWANHTEWVLQTLVILAAFALQEVVCERIRKRQPARPPDVAQDSARTAPPEQPGE